MHCIGGTTHVLLSAWSWWTHLGHSVRLPVLPRITIITVYGSIVRRHGNRVVILLVGLVTQVLPSCGVCSCKNVSYATCVLVYSHTLVHLVWRLSPASFFLFSAQLLQ